MHLERLWEGIKALHMENESHEGQKTKRTPLKDEVLNREKESMAQGADQALGGASAKGTQGCRPVC